MPVTPTSSLKGLAWTIFDPYHCIARVHMTFPHMPSSPLATLSHRSSHRTQPPVPPPPTRPFCLIYCSLLWLLKISKKMKNKTLFRKYSCLSWYILSLLVIEFIVSLSCISPSVRMEPKPHRPLNLKRVVIRYGGIINIKSLHTLGEWNVFLFWLFFVIGNFCYIWGGKNKFSKYHSSKYKKFIIIYCNQYMGLNQL